jgi:hypothetical protein
VTYHLPVEIERPRLDRQFWTNFEQIQTRSSDFIQLLLFQVFDEVQMIKFLEHNYGPDVLFNVCDHGMQASVFIDQMRRKRILSTIKRGDDLLIYQNAELIGILMVYFPHVRNMELAPGTDRLIDKYIPDWNSPSAVAWWRLQRLFMFIWRREHCAATECRRTAFDGSHLSYCGGCSTIRYCTSACQKAAWKHIAAPHRSVCTLYSELMQIRGLHPHCGEEAAGILGQMREPPTLFHTAAVAAEAVLDHEQARTRWEMSLDQGRKSSLRLSSQIRTHVQSFQCTQVSIIGLLGWTLVAANQ